MQKEINGLSVVIPAFNEEESIAQVIQQLKSQLTSLSFHSEVIVVNDASTDNTKQILKSLAGINVLHHKKNKGYGTSLKTGIKNSKYDWVMIIDADGTYPVDAIPNFVKHIPTHELITGDRSRSKGIPVERRLAKKILNSFASYLAGQKVPDLNSGMRIFSKDLVLKHWNLFPERFSFSSTSTMIALTKGYETVFVPIDYFKRKGKSSIKPTHFISFMQLVTKLSLFFKPIKVFVPLSLLILAGALLIPALYFFTDTLVEFPETTFIVLCASALQTFFFGLLAEIIIKNR